VVVLDHHPDNQRFGTVNLVDTDVAATAVLVRRLAAELGWTLTRDVALNLYVGLVTDTGRFRYPNTTPDVFHFAEELAEHDLPIARITRELFEKHRFQYVQLLSMALARCELDHERGFIVAWLTVDDLERFDVGFEETEGFIDHVRACDEAEVACVLREAPGEGLRVSLRSTGSIDVSEMAASFGGGGHAFMSGFTTDRPIPEVIEDLRALVPVQTGPP
jgi:bifunctional oligoribonuclease and PAP phosphatase NrnA